MWEESWSSDQIARWTFGLGHDFVHLYRAYSVGGIMVNIFVIVVLVGFSTITAKVSLLLIVDKKIIYDLNRKTINNLVKVVYTLYYEVL